MLLRAGARACVNLQPFICVDYTQLAWLIWFYFPESNIYNGTFTFHRHLFNKCVKVT